jgi:5'-nucleotidase
MKKILMIACSLVIFPVHSNALNIVLTNDDSHETANVQQLRLALEKAGHDVLVSVPCAHQSGKGGSLGSFLKPTPVHNLVADADGVLSIDDDASKPQGYCVGDLEADKKTKTFADFRDGTPIQAASFGLYKANEIWGKNPDLLISGPNEGRNVGFAVLISGTLGAAHYAISRSVPAVAISAGRTPKDKGDALKNAGMVADIALKIVDELVAGMKSGEPVLPPQTGLNVNTPDFKKLAGAKFQFTNVNWLWGLLPKWDNLGAAKSIGARRGYKAEDGKMGLNFYFGDESGDKFPDSESRVASGGAIAISVIEGTTNAPQDKTDMMRAKLKGLVGN